VTRIYERGEPVRIRVSRDGSAWMETSVLSDLGGETVIVGRSPKKARRVERDRVQSAKPGTRASTPKRNTVAPDYDKTKLYCADGPDGLCATQRQADPPKRAEMAGGVYALCGAWLSGRSAPQRSEPTCAACRSLLGLESDSV
jgi:hypothetical protein